MSVNEPGYFERRVCRVIGILFRGHIFSFKNLACFQPPGMSIYCTALRTPDFDPSRRPGASQGGISRLRSTSYRFPLLMQRLRPAFSADLRPVGGRKSFFLPIWIVSTGMLLIVPSQWSFLGLHPGHTPPRILTEL